MQQGTSATSFQADERSGTENKSFFSAAFGFVKDARRFIVLKPAGIAAVVAKDVVFVQSFRSDTKSIVSKTALRDCVFTRVSHGKGKAAGEGFKGGAAGGSDESGDAKSADDAEMEYDGPLEDEPELDDKLDEAEA